MPLGPGPATVSIHLAEPIRGQVKLRNVCGLLRGSDPALKETCVMVTAHYDHLGMRGRLDRPDFQRGQRRRQRAPPR